MAFPFLIIAYLVQGLIFGFAASTIAGNKGYDTGFAWGFFLGVIGLIVVGFWPTLTHDEHESIYSSSQSQKGTRWECICGASNPDTLDYCLSCRRQRNAVNERMKIVCPHCGATNSSTNDNCFACNSPLHAQVQAPQYASLNAQNIPALIEDLAKLHTAGILSDAEFEQKKAELLARI